MPAELVEDLAGKKIDETHDFDGGKFRVYPLRAEDGVLKQYIKPRYSRSMDFRDFLYWFDVDNKEYPLIAPNSVGVADLRYIQLLKKYWIHTRGVGIYLIKPH